MLRCHVKHPVEALYHFKLRHLLDDLRYQLLHRFRAVHERRLRFRVPTWRFLMKDALFIYFR